MRLETSKIRKWDYLRLGIPFQEERPQDSDSIPILEIQIFIGAEFVNKSHIVVQGILSIQTIYSHSLFL